MSMETEGAGDELRARLKERFEEERVVIRTGPLLRLGPFH